jgi:ribosomal protein L4
MNKKEKRLAMATALQSAAPRYASHELETA